MVYHSPHRSRSAPHLLLPRARLAPESGFGEFALGLGRLGLGLRGSDFGFWIFGFGFTVWG